MLSSANAKPHSIMDNKLPHLREAGDVYMYAAALLFTLVAYAIGWKYFQLEFVAKVTTVLLLAASALFFLARGTWISSIGLPLILVNLVALHIHVGLGRLEFHFGVFLTLALLSVYRHWLPIAVAAIAFAVHHVLFDRLQAMGFPVFCLTRPDFGIVLIHAGYVVAQSIFGVIMAVNMRRDATLSFELDTMTDSLTATKGKVDFSRLNNHVRTESAQRLKGVFDSVENVVRLVDHSVCAVQSASSEIALGSQNLSERSEQSSNRIRETAAAIEQLTSTVANSAAQAGQASELSNDAVQAANSGQENASRMATQMQAITESSVKINDIIGVIDDIAFQTNLLALNAAVEAARAGESGRGFAVVASEVRDLAQRSAAAAQEIKSLITESSMHVESGASAMENTRLSLQEITDNARRVNDLMSDLACATVEQHQGITLINTTINELDRTTEQNSAMVESSSRAASTLAEQSKDLREAIGLITISGGSDTLHDVGTATQTMQAINTHDELNDEPNDADIDASPDAPWRSQRAA